MSKHLCMVSNTAWSMWNFRRGLLSALIQHGYRITIVAPPDNTVFLLCDLGCSFIPLALSPKGVNPIVELKLIFDLDNNSVFTNYPYYKIIIRMLLSNFVKSKKEGTP